MSRVSEKPYFLYVLWSERARRFYVGISEDPTIRLAQHNAGTSKWTAKFGPWIIVKVQEFEDYASARRQELLLKRQKGGDGFYRLTGLDRGQFRVLEKSSGS